MVKIDICSTKNKIKHPLKFFSALSHYNSKKPPKKGD